MRSTDRAAPATDRAEVTPRVVSSPARSLRYRWNRAFAAVFAVVTVGGIANFTGSHLLVETFRSTAERVESEVTLLARLRVDIAAHSGLVHGAMEGVTENQPRITAMEASIRSGFDEAISSSRSPAGRQLLRQSAEQWAPTVTTPHPLDPSVSVAQRLEAHRSLTDGTDAVATLLDQAGAASRSAVRAELDRAADFQRLGVAARLVLGLLVSVLMLRFARRLSAEVLRPVGLLRESANHLAAGELDHRVETNRDDELGDLAASFNAMADSIAGSQRSLTRQAHRDPLTGLANRAAFQARLVAALARPERRGTMQAVLFVDLDDFKDVNDTLGHAAGDEALRLVAARLVEAVRPGDVVARLGGDEFGLLLDGVPDPAVALAVAERAVTALAAPVELARGSANVGASIGLAMRHADSDPDSLMREADLAMYTAKGRGKNRVERYDASLNEALAEHHALMAEVSDAAGRGELLLDYQPIVDLTTGRFTAVEALVRWQHPTRGLLPPSAFIDIAEQTGAIVGIGSWVLETAARQLQSWQQRYNLPELSLSVNVSVRQLDDGGFASDVADVLRRTGLDASCLILEVTESVLAEPAGGTARTLEALRRLGVRVALDDFGTGYSSIGYLRQLPVDILKIDRSFVSGANASRPGDLFLEAIVGLAQRLGLDVIPEGIEDADQLLRLQAMGCRTGQGFHLSRPVAAAAIDLLLAAPAPGFSLATSVEPAVVEVVPGPEARPAVARR